ncbi:MAG: UPF0175 family protein [Anaerolineae bacterium]|nr:UPF0175 family protein [Anaerolineae bacterium]
MYQAVKLSIGTACELAGVNRYVFLDLVEREEVNLKTQTPEDLEVEFRQLTAN